MKTEHEITNVLKRVLTTMVAEMMEESIRHADFELVIDGKTVRYIDAGILKSNIKSLTKYE